MTLGLTFEQPRWHGLGDFDSPAGCPEDSSAIYFLPTASRRNAFRPWPTPNRNHVLRSQLAPPHPRNWRDIMAGSQGRGMAGTFQRVGSQSYRRSPRTRNQLLRIWKRQAADQHTLQQWPGGSMGASLQCGCRRYCDWNRHQSHLACQDEIAT